MGSGEWGVALHPPPRVHHVAEDRTERVAESEIEAVFEIRLALAALQQDLLVCQVAPLKKDLVFDSREAATGVEVEAACYPEPEATR